MDPVTFSFSSMRYSVAPAIITLIGCTVTRLIFLHYRHVLYGISGSRLLIKDGVIGVDYRTPELKNIGATDVNVGLVDKIIGKNTGTLSFGSNASPMEEKEKVTGSIGALTEEKVGRIEKDYDADLKNKVVRHGAHYIGYEVFFKQKTAYDIGLGIPAEPLFRSDGVRHREGFFLVMITLPGFVRVWSLL